MQVDASASPRMYVSTSLHKSVRRREERYFQKSANDDTVDTLDR